MKYSGIKKRSYDEILTYQLEINALVPYRKKDLLYVHMEYFMEYFAGQKLTAMDCELCMYRVFIKYCVFSLIFVIFLNSASSAAALVFYLPIVSVHTLTPRENRKRPESGIFLKIQRNHNIK